VIRLMFFLHGFGYMVVVLIVSAPPCASIVG